VKKDWCAFLSVCVVPCGRPPLLDLLYVLVLSGEVTSVLAPLSGVKIGSMTTGYVVTMGTKFSSV
jgi:hypothetical protein